MFGDSYIESLMNDYPDTLQGSLNDYLKTPRKVLNFGMSGAEMPDYLGTAALVREQFAPEWAVIVITLGDFTRGFSAAPGYFEWEHDRSPPIRAGAGDPPFGVEQVAAHRGADSLPARQPLDAARRAHQAAARQRRGGRHRRACQPEVLSKQDEALLAAFARELPLAAGLAAGARDPGLRFGPQGHLCRQIRRTEAGMSAAGNPGERPPQGDRGAAAGYA